MLGADAPEFNAGGCLRRICVRRLSGPDTASIPRLLRARRCAKTPRVANLRPKILVVEDEPAIADTIVYALRTEGFEPTWKAAGRDALAAADAEEFALVVLDVGLPDQSGFDVCRELQRRRAVPVIFLTARGGEVDRIVGLELGADDYLAKPFSPRELTARVRAVLRRTNGASAPAGDMAGKAAAAAVWQHDAARCRISFHGTALDLTRNEYRLLAALLRSPGRVFSREQLMNAAWDDPGAALDRTVDAHVKLLRAKLRDIAPDADPIVTHRGLGYSLREEA
jgi:two-component system catabolic regulation response regulator CreB